MIRKQEKITYLKKLEFQNRKRKEVEEELDKKIAEEEALVKAKE